MKEFEHDYRQAIGKSGVPGLGDPQVKKDLEERIQRLQTALSQEKDEESQQELQFLLDRAKGDYQKYILAEKRLVQRIRQDMQEQVEYERKKKRQIIIISSIVAALLLVVFIVVSSINANKRAEKNEAAAKAAFQHSTSSQAPTVDEGTKLGDDELFPKNLIGTWHAQQGGADLTLTFEEDGTVSVTTNLSDGSYTTNSGYVTGTLPVDDTTFRLVNYSGMVFPGQYNASQSVAAFGYKLSPDGSKLYPLTWQYDDSGQEPDYSKYTVDEANVFTKEN